MSTPSRCGGWLRPACDRSELPDFTTTGIAIVDIGTGEIVDTANDAARVLHIGP